METYNHLPAFTIHDLAQISDWLDEKGELYVECYPEAKVQDAIRYFVCSIQDVRLMALEQNGWYEIVFMFFRDRLLPLRGIADAAFLQQSFEAYPDKQSRFWLISFAYYPEQIYLIEDGWTHFTLARAIEGEWGHSVAMGRPFPELGDVPLDTIVFVDSTSESRVIPPQRMRYAPYDADPARYQWIVDMWRE